MQHPRAVDPCDFVIFGGTGDLAIRKLLPALYLRDRDGQLTGDTRIIGIAKSGLDDAGYRDRIRTELARFVPAEWLEAAREPAAERPDLTATIGFRRANSGASRAKRRGFPKLSR